MFLGVEVPRRQSVDLPGYSVAHVDGSELRTIGDAYILNPDESLHSTGSWGRTKVRLTAYPYELLSSEWQLESYREIVSRGGRYPDRGRVIGLDAVQPIGSLGSRSLVLFIRRPARGVG